MTVALKARGQAVCLSNTGDNTKFIIRTLKNNGRMVFTALLLCLFYFKRTNRVVLKDIFTRQQG